MDDSIWLTPPVRGTVYTVYIEKRILPEHLPRIPGQVGFSRHQGTGGQPT